MKRNCHLLLRRIFPTTIVFFAVVSCFGAKTPEEILESDRFRSRFRTGDTNAPLLELDWFSGPRSVEFCRVSQAGRVYAARHVINWAIQGGHRAQLDQTNLESLTNAIIALPASINQNLPKERILVVRGFRTNEWFEVLDDRASVPKEVERLYEITGAYLEWFIPEAKGRQFVHTDYGGYHTSQAGIESFRIARSVPLAVSSGVNGIQIWDLNKGTAIPLLFLKQMPKVNFEAPWNPAAISPDGKCVAYASPYATFAIDWKAEKILWETSPVVGLETDGCLTKKVAVGGEQGQYLFVAGARRVERWDLATGKFQAVLATDTPTVQFFETSRDGKTLVGGFNDAAVGGCITMSTSISVWKADENTPAAHIETGQFTGIGISPDGKKLALSVFGNQKLLIWNWQQGTTNQIPFRTPYGSSSQAYSMFWSPDETRFAAYVGTYPASIVIYDPTDWKPLARWKCGEVMSEVKFDFTQDGEFIAFRDHDLSRLDVKSLSRLK